MLLGVVAVLVLAGALAWYAQRPLAIEPLPKTLTVAPGMHLKRLAAMLEREGVIGNAEAFWLLGRVLGKGHALRAGTYTIDTPLTPLALLDKFERGEVTLAAVQFIEGWAWRDVRAALAAQPLLKHDSAGMSDAEIMQAIGAGEPHPEGLFFPDTYLFAPHASDLQVLRRAYRLQQEKLAAAWETRAPNLPYTTPYEALIMASIVEKETGAAFERPQIAGVFVNRLRRGMRLQTDPTVIFGLGDAFDGNLLWRHLAPGQDQLVALDWAYSGVAALGTELAPLVFMKLTTIPESEHMLRFYELCLQGYLAGLADAGYTANVRQVRFASLATIFYRYLYGANLGELWAGLRDEANHPFIASMFGLPSVDYLFSIGAALVPFYQAIFQQIDELLPQIA